MKTEWQPIETAPKDGTEILIFTTRGIAHVGWSKYCGAYLESGESSGGWDVCWNNSDGWNDPEFPDATHWMPLPAPPAELKEGA